MKIYITLGLLLQISAVFQGVSYASGNSRTTVIGDDGTEENVDDNATPNQSSSSSQQLKKDVIFNLYTSSNPKNGKKIYLNDDKTLSASNFNAKNPTRFVIHGWKSSSERPVAVGARDAYLGAGNFNIILVDWTAYSNKMYVSARTKIVSVGEYVGLMIDYLKNKGMKMSDLILIGHSLGAHICGVAGRSASSNVPILIGLDPAGPLFYKGDSKSRMKSTDANFVQVVHTSAGTLGYNGNLGDVDIWVNGGRKQTGCGIMDKIIYCDHSRSHYYFSESISNTKKSFVARKCDSNSNYNKGKCANNKSTHLGGLHIDTSAAHGDYYVNTNSGSPYAMG